MLYQLIEQQLRQAVQARFPDAVLNEIQVRPCPNPQHGDYQSNSLISLAKRKGANPRQTATQIAAQLKVEEWCHPPEVAGAGFLNFKLKPAAIAAVLQGACQNLHLFHQPADVPRTVIIDFSSPNVAKPMHVGHIRSTVLGDSLARIFRYLGHRVITDNHIGDWGTQFGKLIVGWKTERDDEALHQDPLQELERLYRLINTRSESDPAILDQARAELVKLQKGDPANLEIWKRMIELSQAQFDELYQRLGVRFDHALGESFYNEFLEDAVSQLQARGIAQESEGALVVFFEDPKLKGHPAIVRKRDGAANYTTTDLATLEYRVTTWQPDEIVYVTDGRQQLHFQQLFAIWQRWHPESGAKLSHVWFGSILGEDGKPFKTRSGETVPLRGLLDEAIERAFKLVTELRPDYPVEQRREIARVVGIGAVKYADLLPNRQSDYIFSWDKMLSLSGNTAPYLQYAYTRVRSIFRKAESSAPLKVNPNAAFLLETDEELVLAKHLIQFGLILESVSDDHRPNYLCSYLYDLAGFFARFYESCPVLKAPSDASRNTRLALCELTGRVLKQGLDLLGIETLEVM